MVLLTRAPLTTTASNSNSASSSSPITSSSTSSTPKKMSSMEKELERTKTQSEIFSKELEAIFAQFKKQARFQVKFDSKLKERERLLDDRQEELEKREENLTQREDNFAKLEKKISKSTSLETKFGKNQKVKLDIGGKIFATNLSTLTSVKDTFFTCYFNDYFNPQVDDSENSYFIDRPNEQFHLILNFLRGIDIKERIYNLNESDLKDFIEEIVYYQITPIFDLLPKIGKDILKTKYSINSNP